MFTTRLEARARSTRRPRCLEKMCVSNVLDGFPIRSGIILLLGYQRLTYHKSRNLPIIIYSKRLARAPDYDRKRASALTRQNPRKDCLQ